MTALLPFTTALLASVLVIPIIRKICIAKGWVSYPRKDRWHQRPTPRLGGIGIFFAFILSVIIAYIATPPNRIEWGLLGGAIIIFTLGLIDDIRQLSPVAKLIGQIAAASLAISLGRTIGFFPWESLNIIFTFVWLVGITNAINLLDNMDGLASGVSLIAAGLLSYLFAQIHNHDLLTLSMAISGSILGFLIYNFPPASIFMGDSGSLFLGFSLAALSIARAPRASNVLAVLGVPIMLFLLPILDTTLVSITRILRGQSPAQGGKDHTSHRLIAFGLNERQTLIVLYGVALVSGIVGTGLEYLDYSVSLVLLPLILIVFALFTAYLGRYKMVDTPNQSNEGTFARLVVQFTARSHILEIILDFFLISLAYYLAFWTYNGFHLDASALDLFISTLALAVPSAYLAYLVVGIYRDVWQYIGIRDLLRYAGVALLASIILAVTLFLTNNIPRLTTVELFLFGLFLFLGLSISRLSFRIFDQIYRPAKEIPAPSKQNVLIYGADNLGELILRWLLVQPDSGFKPLGIVDNDPFKKGRQIHGFNVIGDIDELDKFIRTNKIQGIICSIQPTSDVQNLCKKEGIWIKSFKIELSALGFQDDD